MRNKKNLIIFLTLLLFIILWSVIGILNLQKNSEPYKVSVIVDNSYHDSWMVLQDGLEQAAADNNIVMKYVFTNRFISTKQQLEVVEREIANGADGVIVQLLTSDVDYEHLSEITQNKGIVLLASDIKTQGRMQVCGVDNKKYGIEAAGQVIEYCAENGVKKIGLVMGNASLVSTSEQLNAIKSSLDEKNVSVEWTLYNTGESLEGQLEKAIYSKNVDVILTIGSIETETCAVYLDRNNRKDIALFGTGYSTENAYYLDKQLIKSMIIPDEFNIGYQAMEMIAEQLDIQYSDSEYRYVDFHTVRCDEIYEPDNERIVFPVVQ